MDINVYKLPYGISRVILSMLLFMSSSILLSCEQQPQSMFEQQASIKSAHDIESNTTANSSTHIKLATVAPAIQANKQQAIARQPNCDPLQSRCQYFELNILQFSPEQPWLTSIMWQTIARVLAPETPLASQDEVAKKTVAMLFNRIEYSEQVVKSLPMYQRIDTDLVLNLPSEAALSSGSSKALDPESELGSSTTGYLVVRSKQTRNDSQQQLTYVMFDMQKNLQLTIEDILIPEVSTNDLLLAFQPAKIDWLTLQGIEQKYHEEWPLQLSRQWYLDHKGLHMIYQAGELLTTKIESVDLLIPNASLQGLIKPAYIVWPL